MKTKKFKVLLCLVCLLVPLLLPVEGLAKEIKSLVNEQKVIQEEYLPYQEIAQILMAVQITILMPL